MMLRLPAASGGELPIPEASKTRELYSTAMNSLCSYCNKHSGTPMIRRTVRHNECAQPPPRYAAVQDTAGHITRLCIQLVHKTVVCLCMHKLFLLQCLAYQSWNSQSPCCLLRLWSPGRLALPVNNSYACCMVKNLRSASTVLLTSGWYLGQQAIAVVRQGTALASCSLEPNYCVASAYAVTVTVSVYASGLAATSEQVMHQ